MEDAFLNTAHIINMSSLFSHFNGTGMFSSFFSDSKCCACVEEGGRGRSVDESTGFVFHWSDPLHQLPFPPALQTLTETTHPYNLSKPDPRRSQPFQQNESI